MRSPAAKLRISKAGTIPDLAGEYLYKSGPTLESDLFVAIGKPSPTAQHVESLQCAISSGWLAVAQGGKIDCSAVARAHYDELAGKGKVVHVGQVAAARVATAYERPPLSKKYMLNSRGSRAIDPRFERPAGFSFKHISGGEA